MSASKLNRVQTYLKRRDEYYVNALKSASKGEFSKASEFLWGAITQSLKALAAVNGIGLGKHKQFFEFMRQISKELRDEELYKSFLFLRKLHINFYEEVIDPQDFQIYLKEAKLFMQKIDEIIKKSVQTKGS